MKPLVAIAYREYRIRLTNPILPLWDVLVPMVYLVVFGSSFSRAGFAFSWAGQQLDYSWFLLGGVLAMVTFSIAMNSSYAAFEDLQSGIFQEMLTYPFPRRELLLGKLLFNGAFGLIASVCCLFAGAFVLRLPVYWTKLPALLIWVIAGTAAWYFFFVWISLRVRGFNAYHTTTSTLYLLLMFISNLFYPVETLPVWIRWSAYLNPITWQVDVLRYLTSPSAQSAFMWEALAFLGFMVFSYWLANRKLNSPVE
jgi:ABC-type multidrug transport system permease subunit